MNKGYIYILTNPSFPDYVKIGYADNVETRLAQLNRSECVPFAFRVYATYEVENRLTDKNIHTIIDKLNPELRSIDKFNGKDRVREFYAMSAEDAYSIIEAIASIHGFNDKLKKYEMNEVESQEDKLAQEIKENSQERASNFSFSNCKIPVGEYIEFIEDESLKIKVTGDKAVEYEGREYSLTALAKELTGISYSIAGPKYFKYKGEMLNDIRKRLGV